MPRSRAAALVLALALGVLSACSSSDDGGGSAATGSAPGTTTSGAGETSPTSTGEQGGGATGQAQSLAVTSVDFRFQLDSTTLPAGDYEIALTNDGHATHDLVVERDGEDVAASDSIGPGDSTTFSVTLEPGRYVFYCSIGNHREMGMEVAVTVT